MSQEVEMVATRTPLIEVLTIKPRMLKQIRILTPHISEQREKWQCMQELLSDNKLHPVGWISGTFIDGAPDNQEMWLIHLSSLNELWLIFAPNRDSQLWKQHQPVPQLFV